MIKTEYGTDIFFLVWLMVFTTCSVNGYANVTVPDTSIGGLKDSTQVRQIIISGNKVTKSRVILNEMVFKIGDSIVVTQLGSALKRSRENLLNTSLFNFVSITYAIQSDGGVIFHVKVDERWYWWVFPIFEHADRNLSSFLENGDWSRMNYGVYLKKDNFRGRKEVLKLKVKAGFSTDIALSFHSPEYKRKTGWGLELNAKGNNELPFVTYANQPIFLSLQNEMAQYYSKISLYYTIRTDLYQRHEIRLSHDGYSVNDTIIELNPNYLTEGNSEMQYVSLSYQYHYDRRDSKAYPLNGTNVKLQLKQMGFGIFSDELNDLSLKARFQQFAGLANRLHWGGTIEGRVSTSDQLPYVLNSGLGYKSFMNGYELYVIDGTNNAMVQNKLLFTILEPKVKNIGFIPLTQFAKIHYAFYLKAYFDFGYAWQLHPDPSNTLVNDWQYGYGLGLDLVTFYDKVLSFNYSANKQGQHGFFIHLNLDL